MKKSILVFLVFLVIFCLAGVTQNAAATVEGNRTDEQTSFPQIWESEILQRAEFHFLPTPEVSVSQELAVWQRDVRVFFDVQYRLAKQSLANASESLALFWVVFMLVGLGAYRSLSRTVERIEASRFSLFFGIICLALVFSLSAAFLAGTLRQTALLRTCAHIIILFGIQALAWLFRSVKEHVQAKKIQPLFPLVVLSAGVSVLSLLRLPLWLEHLAWFGILVVSSFFLAGMRPQLRYERVVRRSHPYVIGLLVVLAFLGWGDVAIMGSALWGLVALAVQLGIGSTSVVRLIFAQVAGPGLRALVADLSVTVLTLGLWLGIALGVMAWMSAGLGASALFAHLSALELNWGDFSLNFLRLGMVVLLFHVVHTLVRVWKTVMASDHLHGKSLDPGMAASLQRVGMYCLWLLYGLVSMNLLGINLTNFAVIAGGLSVGVGFGMQTMISNFISGLILLFDRSIQPGDVLEVNGVWGRVESVNVRNTVLLTYENAKVFVPNSNLIANQLTNWTHRNDVRIRKDVAVGVAYGSDVLLVKKLLLESATEHPAILEDPAPGVLFNDFGNSSLDFILRVWVRHVDFAISAPSDLRETIDRKFRENGVEIPFPQMDVHVRTGDGIVRVRREG